MVSVYCWERHTDRSRHRARARNMIVVIEKILQHDVPSYQSMSRYSIPSSSFPDISSQIAFAHGTEEAP